MKVIDLLTKIANGEEVPKKIRFNNIEWNRVYGEKNVCYIDEYDSDFFLCFFRNNLDFTLNDEVEIIEEDKKIEKIKQLCEYPNTDTYECWNTREEILVKKINEIIDKINKMEDKQ